MWLDRLVVLIGMLGLIAFCGVIMYFVAKPDLILIIVICLAIAVWDFWASLRANNSPQQNGDQANKHQ